MSFVLMAPHELVQTTTLLPSPQFGDADNLVAEVDVKRTMNGTVRTYIKTSSDEHLLYDFILTRMKTLELINFILVYYSYNMRIINHKSEIYVGKLLNDPNDFTTFRVGEENTFRLEFRGKKIG